MSAAVEAQLRAAEAARDCPTLVRLLAAHAADAPALRAGLAAQERLYKAGPSVDAAIARVGDAAGPLLDGYRR